MSLWALVSFLGSIGFLTFAIYQFVKTRNLVRNGIKTTGKIVRERDLGVGSGLIVHTIQFQSRDRGDIEFKNFSFISSHEVNSVVNILYNSRNPGHAKIDTRLSLWSFPLFFGLVGIVGFIVGLRNF